MLWDDVKACYITHDVEGVVAGGVELPQLGVRVWPAAVELTYCVGREWGQPQMAGFFELLRNCCTFDSAAIVDPHPFATKSNTDRFLRAWSSYNKQAEPEVAPDCGGVT